MQLSRTTGLALMLLAALGVGSLRPAHAQIQDGSFEENVASATFYGGQTFGGWTVGAGSIDLVPARTWQAEDGNLSIDLSGDTAGSIYQDVPTVAGQTYQLSFYMAGNPYDQPALKSLNVLAGTAQIGHFTFSTAGTTVAAMGWRLMQATFTATSTTTRITFQSLNNGPVGPTLDNISLSSLSVASPVHTHLLWNNTTGASCCGASPGRLVHPQRLRALHRQRPAEQVAAPRPWPPARTARATCCGTTPMGASCCGPWTTQGNFTLAGLRPLHRQQRRRRPLRQQVERHGGLGRPRQHRPPAVEQHRPPRHALERRVRLHASPWPATGRTRTPPSAMTPATCGAPQPLPPARTTKAASSGTTPTGASCSGTWHSSFNFTPGRLRPLHGQRPAEQVERRRRFRGSRQPDAPAVEQHRPPGHVLERGHLVQLQPGGLRPLHGQRPGQNLWSAQAVATGPDGLSHILWANTDYRAMLWGVDNAFNFTVAGYGPYTDNAPGNLWSATAVSAGP